MSIKLVSPLLIAATFIACATTTPPPARVAASPALPPPAHNLKVMLRDDVGARYELIAAKYILDGETVFERTTTDGLIELPDHDRIYYGFVKPGRHSLTVMLEYRPSAHGIFTYVHKYRLKVASRAEFATGSTLPVSVEAIVKDSGDFTARVEKGPAIEYVFDRETAGLLE
jgi:hypothetical protein